MSRQAKKLIPISEHSSSENGLFVGLIDAVHDDGSVFVLLPDSDRRVRARTAIQLSESLEDPEQLVGCDVLLSVAGPDWENVIILGLVSDTLWSTKELEISIDAVPVKKTDVRTDGRSVAINGDKEIVLTCGKSTIALKRDGTIIIKGTKVTSRAARVNRIKGASVNIN